MNRKLTITEVADKVGVTARTIKRWEDSGKIKRAKRDGRGWRVYGKKDAREIIKFHDRVIMSD